MTKMQEQLVYMALQQMEEAAKAGKTNSQTLHTTFAARQADNNYDEEIEMSDEDDWGGHHAQHHSTANDVNTRRARSPTARHVQVTLDKERKEIRTRAADAAKTRTKQERNRQSTVIRKPRPADQSQLTMKQLQTKAEIKKKTATVQVQPATTPGSEKPANPEPTATPTTQGS